MDSRYQTSVSQRLSKRNRALGMLRVLAQVAHAQHQLGLTATNVQPAIDKLIERFTGEWADFERFIHEWERREEAVHHETAAFVDVVRSFLRVEGRAAVYWGMTSSDLTETTDAVIYRNIVETCFTSELIKLEQLLETSVNINEKRRGRTHGQLAEPVSCNATYLRAARDLSWARHAMHTSMLHGKLSGPVGEYNAAVTPDVESMVGGKLSIQMDAYAAQTADKFILARAAMAQIQLVGLCEQLATFHRIGSIAGVDLYAEGFKRDEQKGSSIMPYKRNPIKSERICGLARVCRGHLSAILETSYTQWWERDLTNSSVERTAFWDLVQLSYFILAETVQVLEGGHWLPDPFYDEDTWESPVDELIKRQGAGEDPEEVYRDIQGRG
jgi:adenylosuccinate lyase